jgi:ACS family hexuronate transporter-like MFS transporter
MTRGVAAEPIATTDRWRVLAAALLVQVTISIVTQAFPALAPFARGELQLNVVEVGLFATILNLGTMFALLPAGWAVDVIGERRVLVVGGLATGVAAAIAATAPQFTVLLPLLIVVGIASATPTPAGSTAIISAFSGRDRGFIMSVRQTGIPLGGGLAALLLPPLAIATGWRHALQVAAVLAAAGALVGLILLRSGRSAPTTVYRTRVSVREIATRDATFMGLAAVFLTLGQFVLVSYIALYLLTLWHLSLAIGSLFLVAANAGGVAGRMLWGTVSDRLFGGRRRGPLITVGLIAAAGFLLLASLPLSTPPLAILTLVILLGATAIGWNGVWVTLLSEIAPPDKRGRTVAYGLTISQVGIFGGPPAFGALVSFTGSFRVGWSVVAGAMLVAALLIRQVEAASARDMTLDRAVVG